MTMAPTTSIDVMLPYYGSVEQFKHAVRSVIAQDFDDWRLVCVDDADPSLEARDWLQSLSDPRIEYRRNARNLGVAGNFSECLAQVTAPYFVIMGGDDIMLPDYLRTVARATITHPEVDVIQPGVVVIDDAGNESHPLADRIKAMLRPRTHGGHVILTGESMAESLVRADWAYFPSLLWKTRTAQPIGFDDSYDVALDLALLLDIALEGGSLMLFDERVFAYRRHHTSVSSATALSGERFDQERRFFHAYAAKFHQVGWRRAEGIARRHVVARLNAASVAASALIAGRVADAWRLLSWALTS